MFRVRGSTNSDSDPRQTLDLLTLNNSWFERVKRMHRDGTTHTLLKRRRYKITMATVNKWKWTTSTPWNETGSSHMVALNALLDDGRKLQMIKHAISFQHCYLIRHVLQWKPSESHWTPTSFILTQLHRRKQHLETASNKTQQHNPILQRLFCRKYSGLIKIKTWIYYLMGINSEFWWSSNLWINDFIHKFRGFSVAGAHFP